MTNNLLKIIFEHPLRKKYYAVLGLLIIYSLITNIAELGYDISFFGVIFGTLDLLSLILFLVLILIGGTYCFTIIFGTKFKSDNRWFWLFFIDCIIVVIFIEYSMTLPDYY